MRIGNIYAQTPFTQEKSAIQLVVTNNGHLFCCRQLLNRPAVMGWHWMASDTPGQQDANFFPPLGILFHELL